MLVWLQTWTEFRFELEISSSIDIFAFSLRKLSLLASTSFLACCLPNLSLMSSVLEWWCNVSLSFVGARPCSYNNDWFLWCVVWILSLINTIKNFGKKGMLGIHSLTRNVWRLKLLREENIFEQVPHRKTSSVSFSVLVFFPTSEVKHLGSFSVVASSEDEDTSRSAIKIGSMELFVCSIFWEGISLYFRFCEPRIKIISFLIATSSN